MWKLEYQLKRHSAPINCIDISPDMTILASASTDGSVGFTNFQTRQTNYCQNHGDPVYGVSFSPNSQYLISCSNNGKVILWDCKENEEIGSFKAHELTIRSVCWSPDGKYIATSSNDQTASIWSLNRFTKRQVLTGLKGWIRDIKWSGNTIAVAGNDSQVLLFDSRTGKPSLSIPTSSSSDVSSISFHNSGQCIAAASYDHIVRIWDLRTSSILQKHSAHTDSVLRVSFNPYNEDLLSVGRDGYAKIWDLKTGTVSLSCQNHSSSVLGCCWLPSSQGFLTSGEDHRICSYKISDTGIDPLSLDYQDGDILDTLEKMQNDISRLVSTMKSIDQRLLLQEERLQWLEDIDTKISRKRK